MSESRVYSAPQLTRQPATRALGSVELLGIAFFVSGFPALIYQLVWQRTLFTIYGVNIESITVVVSAFMLGLGLGSLFGGWLSKRTSVPHLLIFALLEIGICSYGLVSLPLFAWAGEATLGASLGAAGVLTFGLVLLPTALMGATLPLLVAFLVRRSGNVGQSVGWLYFVNTLGSAFACFAVAWWLLGQFGMTRTVQIAAVLNALVAVSALAIHLATSKGSPSVSEAAVEPPRAASVAAGARPSETARAPLLPLAQTLLLAGMLGFISLSYEILWARVFSFASASRAWAFPFMLGSYLAGIALGSLLSGEFCKRLGVGERRRQLRALGCYVLAVNILGFLSIPAIANLAPVADYRVGYGLVCLAAAGLGATLPLISHLGILPDRKAGSRLSYVYLSNIVGSTSGSLITGFVLMDALSLGTITLLLAAAGTLLSALLLSVGSERRGRLLIAAGAGAIVVLLAGLRPAIFDQLYEKLQFKAEFGPGHGFAEVVETKSGVITVSRSGVVFGGGIYDGMFNTDPVHDRNVIVRPYLLSAFHADMREVLVIGVSSGSWTQVLANHPQVERVTAVEINPGYLELIRRYDAVRSLMDNPKVEFVIDDGRRWLSANPTRKFDAIVMNTTYHWRAYASNLLSKEFLQILGSHLKPAGIAFYNTTSSPEVQRTAALAFPHAVRVINFMLVSNAPLVPDRARLRRVLLNYRIDGVPVFDFSQPLHRSRFADIIGLLDTLGGPPLKNGLESQHSILARTEGARPVTDDNMGTEWVH